MSVCSKTELRRRRMLGIVASEFDSWVAEKRVRKREKRGTIMDERSRAPTRTRTCAHKNVPEALWSRNKQAAHREALISTAAAPFKQAEAQWNVVAMKSPPPHSHHSLPAPPQPPYASTSSTVY